MKVLNSASTSKRFEKDWAESYYQDFHNRLLTLLADQFSEFKCSLALSLLNFKQISSKIHNSQIKQEQQLSFSELKTYFSEYDLKRLSSYVKNLSEYSLILDMVPFMARLYFQSKFPFPLNQAQASILAGMGLQRKNVDEISVTNFFFLEISTI